MVFCRKDQEGLPCKLLPTAISHFARSMTLSVRGGLGCPDGCIQSPLFSFFPHQSSSVVGETRIHSPFLLNYVKLFRTRLRLSTYQTSGDQQCESRLQKQNVRTCSGKLSIPSVNGLSASAEFLLKPTTMENHRRLFPARSGWMRQK